MDTFKSLTHALSQMTAGLTFNANTKAVTRLAVIGAVFGGLVVTGCASKEKAPPQTPQQQAMGKLSTERDSFVAQTQSKLGEYQKFAQDLRTRAAGQPHPQAKKMENAADDLDSTLKDVTNSLNNVKSAAPENWLDEKRDVERAMSRADTQYSTGMSLVR